MYWLVFSLMWVLHAETGNGLGLGHWARLCRPWGRERKKQELINRNTLLYSIVFWRFLHKVPQKSEIYELKRTYGELRFQFFSEAIPPNPHAREGDPSRTHPNTVCGRIWSLYATVCPCTKIGPPESNTHLRRWCTTVVILKLNHLFSLIFTPLTVQSNLY